MRLLSLSISTFILGIYLAHSLYAQGTVFPPSTGNVLPSTPGAAAPAMTPLAPAGGFSTTAAPVFDPYASTSTLPSIGGSGTIFPGPAPSVLPTAPTNPSVLGIPNSSVLPSGTYAPPGYGAPGYTAPGYGTPIGPAPITGGYGAPGIYPSTPNSLYPGMNPAYGNYPQQGPFGGLFPNSYNSIFGQSGTAGQASAWNPQGAIFNNGFGVGNNTPGFIRLFQGPRFRHGYVYGGGSNNALAINDSDLSLAFAFPNFLFSNQPLYLLPSFSLHQWSGPFAPNTADLPAVAYSAFLDTGWRTDPQRILGAELGVRVGMFTDFNTANTDSIRVMGRGIGQLRLTPRASLKLGVIYLDRNRFKLLPAGGLVWLPRPTTRLDIFFPEPKLSNYVATFGALDTWLYASAEYGGGAWTIKRADNSNDEIDINDLRVMVGFEFGQSAAIQQGRRNAFVEIGYVFDREIRYQANPMDNLSLEDSILFRAGFGY